MKCEYNNFTFTLDFIAKIYELFKDLKMIKSEKTSKNITYK